MCRSSRILGFLIAAAALAALPVAAQARGLGFAGARFGGLHLGGRFGFGARLGGRPGFRAGLYPGLRGRLGRLGRGYGFGGYGLGGYGVGSYDFGGAELPPDVSPAAGGPSGYPSPIFVPVAPRPPACPLIISVGAGLRHPARTRIVYGHQPVCR